MSNGRSNGNRDNAATTPALAALTAQGALIDVTPQAGAAGWDAPTVLTLAAWECIVSGRETGRRLDAVLRAARAVASSCDDGEVRVPAAAIDEVGMFRVEIVGTPGLPVIAVSYAGA